MKTIVVACQKGGVGKSTLCLNLLTEAIRRGHSAVIADLDDQGSCALMSDQRERIHKQRLPVVTDRQKSGYDIQIIDTAPHQNAALPNVFKGADLILIPVRPATLDLAAAASTITVAQRSGVKMAAVLMLPVARSPEIKEAQEWLQARDVELAGIVHHRIDVARATGQGLGMFELDEKHPGTREFRWIADYAFNAVL